MSNNITDIIRKTDLTVSPLEESNTIPSTWYSEQSVYLFELENLFSSVWQCVGHVKRLEKNGDYFLFNYLDNPLIIIKGNDGKIRAFYNVCQHRGGPLALEDGNVKLLQCKYHGWTYQLDGYLKKAPKFNQMETNLADICLKPVNIDIWEGLIFIALDEAPVKLSDMMNGINKRIAPVDINTLNFYRRIEYNLNCNWKVYIDNYLEGYHLPFVHPGLSKVLETKEYETELSEYYSLQVSPLKEDNIYGKGSAFYYFIFPNIMLNILPGRLQTNLVLPTSRNSSRIIFDYYYENINDDSKIKSIENDIAFSDEVQKEDIFICEKVQSGLESKGYNQGRFSTTEEQGVYHFQSLLKEYYGRYLL
jgi:phenylpropionate dioxygenase-like ring-hydroxylating dioxygenase large terminal subunit